MQTENLDTSFSINSVCRQDLENMGYNTSNISDETMKELAEKMGEAYVEDGFWIDLPIIADNLKITKKPKMQYLTPTTKEEARQYAINWQNWTSEQNLSYGELAIWADKFTDLAKKFNLTEEFKENGII